MAIEVAIVLRAVGCATTISASISRNDRVGCTKTGDAPPAQGSLYFSDAGIKGKAQEEPCIALPVGETVGLYTVVWGKVRTHVSEESNFARLSRIFFHYIV